MAFYTLPEDYRARAAQVRKAGLSVPMVDGSVYTVRNLFTDESANLKLSKSGKAFAAGLAPEDYYTVGLSLAPYTLAGMGNVCGKASPQCAALCLNTAGKGLVKDKLGRETCQRARIAKTRAALSRDPEVRAGFVSALVEQIERAEVRAERKGKRLAVRLNVLSDLPWETLAPWLFERFPNVHFYDYTKNPSRLGRTPSNYDLTFSRSETNEPDAIAALAAGYRVAVVFNHRAPLPETWAGYPVVNADLHDLRFLDGSAVVSGLKAKGRARNTRPGFVVYQ